MRQLQLCRNQVMLSFKVMKKMIRGTKARMTFVSWLEVWMKILTMIMR